MHAHPAPALSTVVTTRLARLIGALAIVAGLAAPLIAVTAELSSQVAQVNAGVQVGAHGHSWTA